MIFRSIALTVALCSITVNLLFGMLTPISLGDEVYHYHFAWQWWESGSRPLYDTLIENSPPYYYAFDCDPLMGFILSFLWHLTNGPTQWIVQIILAISMSLLMLAIYLSAKELYGDYEASLALLLTATVPFFVGYGYIYYLDVPACALVALGVWRLVRKDFLFSGLLFALAFLCKRNTWLFIPFLALAVPLLSKDNKINSLLKFATFPALLCLPELWWRWENWHGIFYPNYSLYNFAYPRFSNIDPYAWGALSPHAWGALGPHENDFHLIPSHLMYYPQDLLLYLGIGLCGSIALFPWRRKASGRDSVVVILLVGFLSLWLALFHKQLVLRYAGPAIPLLCLLAAGRLGWLKVKGAIVLSAVLAVQMMAAGYVMYTKRTIPPNLQEAYHFVRTNTPENDRFLTPRYYFSLATGRPMIWVMMQADLYRLLYLSNQLDIDNLASKWHINYIFIDKDRINSGQIQHRLGLPQRFLNIITSSSSWRKVFENNAATIYQRHDP